MALMTAVILLPSWHWIKELEAPRTPRASGLVLIGFS
jgi:hypothetical protein